MTKNISRRNLTFGASMAAFLTGCGGGGDSLVPESTSAMPGAPRMNAQTTGVAGDAAEVQYADLVDTPLFKRMLASGKVDPDGVLIVKTNETQEISIFGEDFIDNVGNGDTQSSSSTRAAAVKKKKHYNLSRSEDKTVAAYRELLRKIVEAIRPISLAYFRNIENNLAIQQNRPRRPITGEIAESFLKSEISVLKFKEHMRAKFGTSSEVTTLLLGMTTVYEGNPDLVSYTLTKNCYYHIINHSGRLHEDFKLVVALFSFSTLKKYNAQIKLAASREITRHLLKRTGVSTTGHSDDKLSATLYNYPNGGIGYKLKIQIGEAVCPLRRKDLIHISSDFYGAVYPYNLDLNSVHLNSEVFNYKLAKEHVVNVTRLDGSGVTDAILVLPRSYTLTPEMKAAVLSYCKEDKVLDYGSMPPETTIVPASRINGTGTIQSMTGATFETLVPGWWGKNVTTNSTTAAILLGAPYRAYVAGTLVTRSVGLTCVGAIRAVLYNDIINIGEIYDDFAAKFAETEAISRAIGSEIVLYVPNVPNTPSASTGNYMTKLAGMVLMASGIASCILTAITVREMDEAKKATAHITNKAERDAAAQEIFDSKFVAAWDYFDFASSFVGEAYLMARLTGWDVKAGWSKEWGNTLIGSVFSISDISGGSRSIFKAIDREKDYYWSQEATFDIIAGSFQLCSGLMSAMQMMIPDFLSGAKNKKFVLGFGSAASFITVACALLGGVISRHIRERRGF